MLSKLIISAIRAAAPAVFNKYLEAFPGGDNINSIISFRQSINGTLNKIGDPEAFCQKVKMGLDLYIEVRTQLLGWARGRGYARPESYAVLPDRIFVPIEDLYNKLRFSIDTGVITNENWSSFKEETVKAIDDVITSKASHKYIERS